VAVITDAPAWYCNAPAEWAVVLGEHPCHPVAQGLEWLPGGIFNTAITTGDGLRSWLVSGPTFDAGVPAQAGDVTHLLILTGYAFGQVQAAPRRLSGAELLADGPTWALFAVKTGETRR
jgi:hypothetical protein